MTGQTLPATIWSATGSTEHLGGPPATRHLLERCRVSTNNTVLDLGCGTGVTASACARQYAARVVGLDLHPTALAQARQRLKQADLSERVGLVRADVHRLPLRSQTFDVVLAESVLVFCRASEVTAEACRVLRRGGSLGLNELTFRRPPPGDLSDLLANDLSINARDSAGWCQVLRQAGLVDIVAETRPYRLAEQLAGHIDADGWLGYVRAAVRGLRDVRVSRLFVSRRMLRAAREFLPYVGYGLYAATKPSVVQQRYQASGG